MAFAVGVLTSLAFVLRLANIRQSLFQDEFWTYGIVTHNGPTGVLSELYDYEISPPLHFLLAWLGAQIGDPKIGIRIPSLVFGTATVPVSYLLGRRIFGSATGLFAASLLTLSPFAIFYGVEGRAYATIGFLVALSTLALVHALDEGRQGWWVAYATSACAALYTHYTVVFVLGAQAAWAFWCYRDRLRPLLIAHLAIIVAYLPWLPGYLDQRDNAGVATTEAIGLDAIGAALNPHPVTIGKFPYLLPRVLPGHPFLKLAAMPGRLGLALLLIGGSMAVGAAFIRLVRNGLPRRLLSDRRGVLIVILALATPVGLLAYGAIGLNLYTPRNMSASIPALAIVVAALVTSSGRRLAPVSGALILAAFAVGAVKSRDIDRQRPDFREVARFLDGATRPGDLVVDESLDQMLGGGREGIDGPLQVYLKRVHTVLRANVDDEAAWQRAARGGRVFFVRLQAGLFQGLPRLGAPDQSVVLRGKRTFPGLAPLLVGRYQGEVAGRLRRRAGHAVIDWSFGKGIDISPRAARGSVDSVTVSGRVLSVAGWAIKGAGPQKADWVLAFVGRRLLATGRQGALRPDVAKVYGTRALISGFKVTAQSTRPNELADLSRLRLFAVAGRRASELRFSKSARKAARAH